SIPVTFERAASFQRKSRPGLIAPIAKPVWTFDAQSPLWADAAFANGTVFAGGDDGRLHAFAARSGKPVWNFRAGAAIRARATIAGEDIFVQADDGFLYKLDVKTGRERWRVRLDDKPIDRRPIGNPKSRYDYRASAAALQDGRLYIGTFDGHVLALDSNSGK